MVRDYTKWDDMPVSLGAFAESAVRAYKIAMTPPMEPVVLVADGELQELPAHDGERLRVPRLSIPKPPVGDSSVVEEAARMLVGAENPVILTGRLGRTQNSIELVRELAEALQCNANGEAMPARHPLRGGNVGSADVILALELDNVWGAVNAMSDQLERPIRSRLRQGAKLITISSTDLFMRSNYQDFQRFQEVDVPVAADAEATLPHLIEAVKRLTTSDRRIFFADRGKKLAAAKQAADERTRRAAAVEWDLSPISLTRVEYELWDVIKNKDWSLVSRNRGIGSWDFKKFYHQTGDSGAAGVGYSAPASVGAALANRKHGRLSINVQNDGDLMYAPGVLWTAAHHRIPMLAVMNNNRAYHAEVMHLQRMSCRHNRDLTTAPIGNVITDPNIDYAKLAQSMGWYAEGPITDPKEVGPALKRALAVVEKGEPALLDTVMQPG
jgi:acetolactate synthase-1/2/3 large subunit